MLPLQVLSTLFALAMIYWTYLSYRRGTIVLIELVFWLACWGGFASVVIFPSTTTVFLEKLNVNRTMDLMLIVGFMLVWVVLFANHLETRKLTRRLQELVRQLALSEGDKK